ncbi:DUF58 domain-containing protein [Shewanella avicenniae]|uniref:DUF58 domain-containing protein n=1 Tax=Shewanella avicenniae TaxID=2814294 RepID=A0ABX7QV62_9GAMM|nr:DUF58 domain-containing protein [Shewanella avicenniae]QSX35319.1 DUF58 domain-containing protein [Shewanella avicenniae]
MPAIMQRWFSAWLKKRIPAANQQTLSHHSIFILPSGFGLVWVVLIVLLFLFGTNYQNNLVIGMALLLASVFVSTILHSYRNLAGLTLLSTGSTHTYAGQELSIPVKLYATKSLYQLQLSYPHNPELKVDEVSTEPQPRVLAFKTLRRGRVIPGRLMIESRYPLGLCRVWSWLDLNTEHLAFPKPIAGHLGFTSQEGDIGDGGVAPKGVDEYAGLRSYIPGESLKQVAWKQWAQERGMLSKEFTTPEGDPVWLQLPKQIDNAQLEHWLSVLCYQIDELAKNPNQYWGLQLGHIKISPATGQAHRIACLSALACYQAELQGGIDD